MEPPELPSCRAIVGCLLSFPTAPSHRAQLSHFVRSDADAVQKDNGPLHNANPINTPYHKLNMSLFGGTALAIAYTSDPWAAKPEEMTVISVNYTSPWRRLVEYQIPEGLPPCPKGGCICTWNWIHTRKNGEGYGNEIVSFNRVRHARTRVARQEE